MNQLESQKRINTGRLDQSQYFQSLFQEICKQNLLAMERIEKLQLELVELMGKEVERYTNGESTSIRVEKAQEILQSITYCLGIYLKKMDKEENILEILNTERISSIFYKGMDLINSLKNKAEQLLRELQKNMPNIDNYAYRDTLAGGIDVFFQKYEMEFQAHDTPANIDYPLSLMVENLLGVEYIYEYLRRFTLEHNFITKFGEEQVGFLLSGFHEDSEHMLINIFELVLTNALGCAMLEKDIMILDISAAELNLLQSQLTHFNASEIRIKLSKAMEQITLLLNLDSETVAYAQYTMEQLIMRLQNNLKTAVLGEIFVSFSGKPSKGEETFIEGNPMEDEKLRELIEELKEIPLIPEKIRRIREAVHSFEDLKELLDECFYGDEYEEVFKQLNEQERIILKNNIMLDAGPNGRAGYEPDKLWQKILLRY